MQGVEDVPTVAFFLDAPNIYLSCRERGVELDPGEMIRRVNSFGRLVKAIVYLQMKSALLNETLARTYNNAGYTVKFVPPAYGSKDIDTTMVTDIAEAIYENAAAVVVIASGDGDFVPVADLARRKSKSVVLLSFPENCNEALRCRADRFISLSISDGKREAIVANGSQTAAT